MPNVNDLPCRTAPWLPTGALGLMVVLVDIENKKCYSGYLLVILLYIARLINLDSLIKAAIIK